MIQKLLHKSESSFVLFVSINQSKVALSIISAPYCMLFNFTGAFHGKYLDLRKRTTESSFITVFLNSHYQTGSIKNYKIENLRLWSLYYHPSIKQIFLRPDPFFCQDISWLMLSKPSKVYRMIVNRFCASQITSITPLLHVW